MKKLIVILAVLALAMPSMAATTLTGSASGTTITIGYSYDGTGSRPRAFALRIQTSAGTISAVTPLKALVSGQQIGISTAASPGYGIFPGTISIEPNGVVKDFNTPVEKATLRGAPSPQAAGTGIGTNAVVVALASLYVNDANKPLNSANLMTVAIAGAASGTVTVTPEVTARGGVVGEDAAAITISNPSQTLSIGFGAPPECVKTSAPFYNDWASFSKPSCWCYARHGRGDADGKASGTAKNGYIYVSANDLNVLVAGWGVKEPPYGSGIMSKSWSGISAACADFDHAKSGTAKNGYQRVTANDLNILTTYWGIKQPPYGSGVPTGQWLLNSPAPGNPVATDPANYNSQY